MKAALSAALSFAGLTPVAVPPNHTAGSAQTRPQPLRMLFLLPQTPSPLVKTQRPDLEAQFRIASSPRQPVPGAVSPPAPRMSALLHPGLRPWSASCAVLCTSALLPDPQCLSHGWVSTPPCPAQGFLVMPGADCPWGCMGVGGSSAASARAWLKHLTACSVPRTALGARLQGLKKQVLQGLKGEGGERGLLC